ncbi:MAG: TIGR03560 family F420-dependent LLM class oxidoreductase [Chloroflexota bacterium]|nr:TIGR03560 family F420-dependent LLM class oxidoreductase [Chloroflexota bacterium]
MIDVAVMIEGQHGLNWPRWHRLAQTVEAAGYAGLYSSDHLTTQDGPKFDSLELWSALTWLASHTERIEFGPLVSPVSFRDPVITAWTACAVDDLSGGRLRLGIGAGWQEREHQVFGFDLPTLDDRFARFAEGLEVITKLLRSDEPVSFNGRFYQLEEAQLLPRPTRPGGPPVVIGGNGPNRTLPLAARFADEWNAVGTTATGFAELNAQLDGLITAEGRQPGEVRRTLMTRVITGDTQAEIAQRAGGQSVAELEERGALIGDGLAIAAKIRELEEAGVQRVMLQWLELDDLAGIEALAKAVC